MCEVTIAITLYNLEAYIEDALLSVLDQDFEDMEVLVCDDCSTDRSLEVVDRIVKGHEKGTKVKVLTTGQNSGTAASRNMAIDNAQGTYLMFLDGDDLLAPHALSALYQNMKETNADMIIGGIMWLKEKESLTEKLKERKYQKFKPGVIHGDFAIAEWLKFNKTEFFIAGLVNKFFKTSFIRENNIRCKLEHRVVEDQYFFFLVQQHVRSISTLESLTYVYRERGSSVVHTEVSEPRMRLYMKVFNDIKNGFTQLRRENPGVTYPPQLYYLLTSRYLYGFVTKNVMASTQLSLKSKNDYLKQISTIRDLGLKSEDFVSEVNKIYYKFLKYPVRFWLISFAGFAVKVIEKVHKVIS